MTSRSVFKTVMREAMRDQVIVPQLRNYLYQSNIPAYTVPMIEFKEREPDGWFHPSTHPTWTDRQLFYYLMACDGRAEIYEEPRDPMVNMAAMSGNFWHAVLQTCGLDMGL